MTQANTAFSLEDLDAVKHSVDAFEFEYVNASGDLSGIWLSVLGGQSESVSTEVARLINDRRRKEAAREINKKIGVGKKAVDFETFESDVEFGQRLAAVRLVGWRGPGQTDGLAAEQIERFRGISAPYSVENALKLCRSNREIAAQITQNSDEMANFIGI